MYHQNIRRTRDKIIALLSHLYPGLLHMLCFTKHRLNHLELKQTYTDNYNLGTNYCRMSWEKGGLCIYVYNRLNVFIII